MVSMELSDSATYTSATAAVNEFLNLQPLVVSIERVLNDYRPAAYVIAFVLLVVGTMREFIYPETRRFLEAVLRATLLVASISFAPSFINWCDQGIYGEKSRKLPTKLLVFPPFSTDFHHC